MNLRKTTKKEYRKKLVESVLFCEHRNPDRPDLYYYENAYADKIKAYFEEKGIKSLELNYSKRTKTTPICSFISSGRLCYNYFRFSKKIFGHIKSLDFELPLENDLPNAKDYPTKMDAADVQTGQYFECKCDEITSNKHDYLSVAYKNHSLLFKDFKIKDSVIEDYNYTDKKGNIRHCIKFPASALIEFGELAKSFPRYKTCCYNEMFFDLKQFICHLIALARVDGHKDLIYVIFVPKDNSDYYPQMVLKEMESIKWSKKIRDFLYKHDISFKWEFVPIPTVMDMNYVGTYLLPKTK